MLLIELCKLLEKKQVKYALVGGYAVALHGAVRGTVDIDLAIVWEINQLKTVEASLQEIGLISKLPIDAEQLYHFREEYIINRNLIAWSFYHPKDMTQQVDIIINYELKDQKIINKQIGLQNVKVLNIADLIKMKEASGRPQDIEDVKALRIIK